MSNLIFKWGTVFWFSIALSVLLFDITYPMENRETLKLANHMFLLGNMWAIGYMLDLRMKEMIQETFVNFSDGRLDKLRENNNLETARQEKKDNWYEME